MAFSPVDTTLIQVDQGIETAASIAYQIPGVGPIISSVLQIGEAIVNMIGIRSGADEADVITKVQKPLGDQLIAINTAIPYANVKQLQTMYSAVQQMGQQFRQFVAQSIFTDGRASTQALNTIMPLVDGTGDYTSKTSAPGCTHCGPSGGGEDGILGSINRQLSKLGASLMYMSPPLVTQGYGSSFYPSLQSPSTTYNSTIQAGNLPLYSPSTVSHNAPAVVDTGFFGAGYWPLLIGAGLIYLLFRRKG